MKIIKTEEQYREYLRKYKRSENEDEKDLLLVLMNDYKDRAYPLHLHGLHPVEVIKERMKEIGLRMSDMYKYGLEKSAFYKVLQLKRGMSIQMIRKISKALDIPVDLIIEEYPFKNKD